MSGLLFSTDSLSGTPTTGTTEYNGTSLYFTPSGTQRGVVPGQQMFVLGTAVTGLNATSNQSIFGLTSGVTLSSGTTYAFEAKIDCIKTAGTTTHTFQTSFAGTATLNSILYSVIENDGNGGMNQRGTAYTTSINTASTTAVSGTNLSAATQWVYLIYKGIVSVNAGGTFLPQYSLSAAPGGAYTTQAGSYFLIYPIATGSANVNIGTWS
jgi:hypothetical protein